MAHPKKASKLTHTPPIKTGPYRVPANSMPFFLLQKVNVMNFQGPSRVKWDAAKVAVVDRRGRQKLGQRIIGMNGRAHAPSLLQAPHIAYSLWEGLHRKWGVLTAWIQSICFYKDRATSESFRKQEAKKELLFAC